MATLRKSIFNWKTVPDATGDVFFEPYPIKATNDQWDNMVLIFNDTSTRIGVYGSFEVPQNYVGSANIVAHWTSTATTADVEWDFDYRVVTGDDTESLDQSGTEESVNQNDTAPSAIHERMTATQALTDANFHAGATVEFFFARDGADGGDLMAAAAIVFDAHFEYTDA